MFDESCSSGSQKTFCQIKAFIESEEDELRFTYKKGIKLYGMTLQVQLAADLSKVRT